MNSQVTRSSGQFFLTAAKSYGWFCRLLGPASGLTVLSFNRLTNFAFSKVPENAPTHYLDGPPVNVDVLDYHGRVLFLFGTNDPKVAAVAQSLLRSGDVFLDIGANYSSIGLSVRDIVGTDGDVHLFEPQPDLCARVDDAIKAGKITNVHLHQIGLLDCDGTLELSHPEKHTGKATFVNEEAKPGWSHESVEVRDIATAIPPLLSGRPFGVKLDIEGAEMRLLPWLVKQEALRFLIVELNRNQDEIWDVLAEAGFVFYGLSLRVFKREVCLITRFEEAKAYNDVVAIRTNIDRASLPTHVSTRGLAKLLA